MAKPLGKYAIDLGNSSLEASIVEARLHLELDALNDFQVVLAQSGASLGKLRNSELPKKASVKWHNKTVFSGRLANVSVLDHSRVVLSFRDKFFGATKASQNGFLKPQSLKNCISGLADTLGVEARFHGSFSEEVPGLSLAGKTLWEHLSHLSQSFGFFFSFRSGPGTLECVKLGSHIESNRVSENDSFLGLSAEQNAERSYKEISFTYFDPSTMEKQTKTLPSNELYKALDKFAQHTSYQDKLGWAGGEGTVEVNVTDRYHFENGPQLFSNQYAKALHQQEQVRFRTTAFLGLPGDASELSETSSPHITQGKYLVDRLKLSFRSACAKADYGLMRP